MKNQRKNCSGQAMIEFVVAIFAIVFLTAGILQFVELAGVKGKLMLKLRGEAGPKALSTLPLLPDSPDYLRTWEEGDDQLRHTADDVARRGQAGATLQRAIVDRTVASSEGWQPLQNTINSDIYDLHETGLPMAALGLLRTRNRETVELMPAMRNWLLGRDSITIGAEVWLPRMHLEGFDP